MKNYIYLLLFIVSISCQAQTITGKVVRIADGDSFTLLTEGNKQVRIRLFGIDCPENGQPYSNVAKDFTGRLLKMGKVVVHQKDIDRYERVVGVVMIADSINLNERLLQSGLAWHYTYFDKNPKWAEYERQAKQNKLGLWQESSPVAPWDWRKTKRSE